MPVYEYDCRTCAHQFEVLVRGKETPECPACHGKSLDRRLSTFAAHANGSGRRMEAPMACGRCGDPRGPGACSNWRWPWRRGRGIADQRSHPRRPCFSANEKEQAADDACDEQQAGGNPEQGQT